MKKCRFSISANFTRIRPAPSGCISCELTVTFTVVRKSPLGVVYYLNESSSTTTHRPRPSGDRAGDERPCGDLLPAQALQGPLPALFAFPTGSDVDVDVKVHATVAAVYNEPRPMVRGGGGGGEAAEVGRLGGGLGFWQCSSPTHTHTHTHARINVASSMTTTTTSPRENPAGQDSRCDFPCDLTSFACRCRTVTCHASRTSAHR